MTLKNKVVSVLGGAGFIGSNLCDILINQDIKTLVIFDNLCASSMDNINHLLKDERVVFVRGDMRDYDVLAPIIRNSDIVFNLVAGNVGNSLLRPRVDLETNIIGTFNMLQAALDNPDVRIIHASSGSVLGSGDKPMKEDSVLNPTTPYAISKMTGEKYCQYYAKEHGVKVSIIRFFHVFGPRQDYNGKCGVINIFLYNILNGKPPIIWGSGEQIKCFTYVTDSIAAALLLLEKDESIGEIYNVASEVRISISDLANLLIDRYAENKNMKPLNVQAKKGENMRPIPDTSKIKELGWNKEYKLNYGLDLTKIWLEDKLKYENSKRINLSKPAD